VGSQRGQEGSTKEEGEKMIVQIDGHECKWCNKKFNNFAGLHHHVYRGLCINDPYPEMRKIL